MEKLKYLLIILAFLSGATGAEVIINVTGKLYTFKEPVKLATVLSVVNPKPDYWANAAVFHLNDAAVEQQRTTVLQQLAELIRQQSKGSNSYRQLSALYQQIGSWKLMRRLNIDVDYDQARVNPKQNPRFNDGMYYIKLNARAPEIRLSGMLLKQTTLAFNSLYSVSDYVNSVDLSDDAHRDYVYLLESNGVVKKLGIAYWNNQYYRPMPGSEIFIPLQDDLFFDRIGPLNDNIAQLMMHRM